MITPLVELPAAPLDVPPELWDSEPGDQFAMDADITIYWPAVRPCWEPR